MIFSSYQLCLFTLLAAKVYVYTLSVLLIISCSFLCWPIVVVIWVVGARTARLELYILSNLTVLLPIVITLVCKIKHLSKLIYSDYKNAKAYIGKKLSECFTTYFGMALLTFKLM